MRNVGHDHGFEKTIEIMYFILVGAEVAKPQIWGVLLLSFVFERSFILMESSRNI